MVFYFDGESKTVEDWARLNNFFFVSVKGERMSPDDFRMFVSDEKNNEYLDRIRKFGLVADDRYTEADLLKIADGRGGKREGAGRKPSVGEQKTNWSVKVTEAEKASLKEYLQKIRESK